MKLITSLLCLLLLAPKLSVAALTGEDIAWLNRITYGINQQTVQEYNKLGREKFLDKQLHPPAKEVFDENLQKILMAGFRDPQVQMEKVFAERRAFNRKTKDTLKRSKFDTVMRMRGNKAMGVSQKRHLMRAVYSPWQLKEQMSWFWLNHFSVYSRKLDVRWQVGDYEDRAIRPYALGKFKDLLLATMTHPAMVAYLDGYGNTKNKLNENYGRELLELHTMGVGSGYTQKDVTEVARILTGISVQYSPVSKQLAADAGSGFFRKNGIQFLPSAHDFGDKTVLHTTIKGSGWGELEQLADLLSRQPATARHISNKLAQFFMGNKPDAALVKSMSEQFLKTDGDISKTLLVLFKSEDFKRSLKSKFRTPIEVVVSTARLAYEDRPIQNYVPFQAQLARLDQGLYMRVTPDGYPLEKSMWDGSSQLISRFEAVRVLSTGNANFFSIGGEQNQKNQPPNMDNDFFEKILRPHFSQNTLSILDGLKDKPLLWNAMFFSSPEWMNREFK